MITRISSVIRLKGSDLIFDHPYNAEYLRLSEGGRRCRIEHISPFGVVLSAAAIGGIVRYRRGWSRCGLLVTVNAPAAAGVPGAVVGIRPSGR
jgi:hypothetical protein